MMTTDIQICKHKPEKIPEESKFPAKGQEASEFGGWRAAGACVLVHACGKQRLACWGQERKASLKAERFAGEQKVGPRCLGCLGLVRKEAARSEETGD